MKTEWVANGLPTTSNPSTYPADCTYVGAPTVQFQTINGVSVLNMSDLLPPLHRVGWTLAANFNTSNFRYEVRFNTLTQSADMSIDGFIELWILDTANSNRFDIAGLFGSYYSTDLKFFAGGSIDGSYTNPAFDYQNDTWYRLVLEGGTNENIRASLLDDQGTELVSLVLAHNTSAYPSGFTIGLSQGMGTPTMAYPQAVAVDFVALSTSSGAEAPSLSFVPSPEGLALYWPVSADNFAVETASSLSFPIQWITMTNQVEVLNGMNSIPVAFDQPSQFFRLIQRQP